MPPIIPPCDFPYYHFVDDYEELNKDQDKEFERNLQYCLKFVTQHFPEKPHSAIK